MYRDDLKGFSVGNLVKDKHFFEERLIQYHK